MPPVARLLCMESREIPTPHTETHVSDCELEKVGREAESGRGLVFTHVYRAAKIRPPANNSASPATLLLGFPTTTMEQNPNKLRRVFRSIRRFMDWAVISSSPPLKITFLLKRIYSY